VYQEAEPASFELDLNGTLVNGDGTFEFDGAEIDYEVGDGPITLSAKLEAASYDNWDAEDNLDGTVTFTAKEDGYVDFDELQKQMAADNGYTTVSATLDVSDLTLDGEEINVTGLSEGTFADVNNSEDLVGELETTNEIESANVDPENTDIINIVFVDDEETAFELENSDDQTTAEITEDDFIEEGDVEAFSEALAEDGIEESITITAEGQDEAGIEPETVIADDPTGIDVLDFTDYIGEAVSVSTGSGDEPDGYSGYVQIVGENDDVVKMYENADNEGEYLARHYEIEDGDPSLLGIIGTIDFGTSGDYDPADFNMANFA